jgi:hypothetical protein
MTKLASKLFILFFNNSLNVSLFLLTNNSLCNFGLDLNKKFKIGNHYLCYMWDEVHVG